MKEVAVLLRFDTEDFMTPQSDDAALAIADLLTGLGVRGTFPVTAWKVRALGERRRQDVIAALGRHDVGFHSTSHSFHPTIAEELERTADSEAAAAFEERESGGMHEVEAAFSRTLSCYTQPGANWVAEASTALVRWGIPMHYSESWNAYIDVAGRPFHLGATLHFSEAVACPKPFLSRLPSALADATAIVDAAVEVARDAPGDVGLVNVVAHPTELVTEVFWDALNFGGGINRPREEWMAPATRPAADVKAATDALSTYVRHLRDLPGVTFWGAADLVRAYPDVARSTLFRHEDAISIARSFAGGRIGAVAIRGVPLSPAEALILLSMDLLALDEGRERAPIRLPAVMPCFLPEPLHRGQAVMVRTLLDGARPLAAGGVWGEAVADVPMSLAAGALAKLLLARLADGTWPDAVEVFPGELLTERWVRPENELHWDWPVFAPGFRAPGLRRRALRAAWTLKPSEAGLCDYRFD